MSSEQEGPKVAGCDPPGAAQRNRYFRGKLLTVADYVAEQRYHIERRHLINRAIHGWGVISGFAVAAEGGALLISPGLAFDPQGRELLVCTGLALRRDTDILWLRGDAGIEPTIERPADGEAPYLLSAHYAERGIDGVLIDDGRGDSICEANRLCETVVFSLARPPSRREDREAPADAAGRAPGPDRAAPDFDLCRRSRLSRRGDVDVDLHAAVALARVTVRFDGSRTPIFAGVDPAFEPRRLGRSSPGVVPAIAEPAPPRTGGPLLSPAVRVLDPVPSRPAPDEALERARLAGEAEAAHRAAEQALAEARSAAESARKTASEEEGRLRQATQAHQQADAHLAILKTEAGATADRLPQATKARREAEMELVRLNAEAKAQADIAADAQRKLEQARDARLRAEAGLVDLDAALAAAARNHREAADDVSRSGGDPARARDFADAERGLEQAADARRQAQADLDRLTREEAEADAGRQAAVAPAMIEAAEQRVKRAAKEEVELKAAVEKGVTPKMVGAAEERVAIANKEEEEARKRAETAKEEERLRVEALAVAELKHDTTRAIWQERVRQRDEPGLAADPAQNRPPREKENE
jgi:hypothetical protein